MGECWMRPAELWPGTMKCEAGETRVHIPTRRPHLIQPVVDAVRQRGWLIISVAPARQSLEELFLESLRTGRSHQGGRA